MERLMSVLATIGFAKDDATLKYVTAMTWQDPNASELAKFLADYSDYANYTIGELKELFSNPRLDRIE